MRRSIVSVAGDAGGAEALVPVLQQALRQGTLGEVWAGPAAMVVFERAGVPAAPAAEAGEPAERLAQAGPAVLATGTSWGAAAIETAWLDAASAAGVPSLSMVDFWSNYRTRFLAGDDRLVLPDVVAVPDANAAMEAAAEGIPEHRIAVTGNPYYEMLLERYRGFDREVRLRFRESVALPRTGTVVLFASQPIRALYGDRLGYTEDQVLEVVADALGQVAEWIGHPVVLAVRAHPRQGGLPLPRTSRAVLVRSAAGDDPLGWSLAADLVVGMNSAMLLQAALLGSRVVSVQPGLAGADVLPSNRFGLSDGVYRAEDVAPALYRALARPAHLGSARAARRLRASGAGATARVMDQLGKLGLTTVAEASA